MTVGGIFSRHQEKRNKKNPPPLEKEREREKQIGYQ